MKNLIKGCFTPIILGISLLISPFSGIYAADQASSLHQQTLRKELTSEDIHKLIIAAPVMQQTMKQLNPPKPDQSYRSELLEATFAGRIHSKVAGLLQGSKYLDALDSKAKEYGYSKYMEYAHHADSASAVMLIDSFVRTSYKFKHPDLEFENLWEHMHNPSTPEQNRIKLQGWMDEMLEKRHLSRQSTELVYRQFAELKPLFGNF